MTRRLALLAATALATLATTGCGSHQHQPSARVTAAATAPGTEATNLTATGGTERATLTWEAASTTNLLHWLIETQTSTGGWSKQPELPPEARAATLKLPAGEWHFRVWAVVKQNAAEHAATITAPPPPPAGLLAGLNAGYWGASELTDLHTLGIKVVRLDTPTNTSSWEAAGLKVIADESGPYTTSGVSGVNVANYVARDIQLVKTNPQLYAVETLNEPGGNWFWGPNSESASNREAYARLVIAVHQALLENFGGNRPLQLCSMDGGHDSSDAFGEAWTRIPHALEACDLLTNHPYGGTGERARARLGNRPLVERTHTVTGKPVAVTEVGFPTKGPTGDSLQYTETEQAAALYQFDAWAATTGYIPVVTEYGYRDSTEGGGYGVELHNGTRKRAWTAVQQYANGQPCTVCT